MTLAALFVDPNGIYSRLGLDCWGIERDARKYIGSGPVICHPPCQLWTNFAHLNYSRYGGEHNKPGNDGGCFLFAMQRALQLGGVLEHPAGSHAFRTYALPRPVKRKWTMAAYDVWVCEVCQSAYGHKAKKTTWLLYSGPTEPFDLDWSSPQGTHQIGWFDRKKPTLGKREASATPIDFAKVLIRLAELAIPPPKF